MRVANRNLKPVTVRQRIDQLAAEPPVRDLGYAADQRLVAGALLGLAGRERLAAAPRRAAMVAAVDEQRHRDVFAHLQSGLGALRRPDARDLLPVQPLPLARGQLIQAAPVVADLTLVWCQEPRGDMQQGRLPTTAGAVHADHLPALELERHVGEGVLAGAGLALEAL